MFSRKNIIYVDVEEMNKHLKYALDYYEIIYRAKQPSETFQQKAFIEDGLVYFKLSFRRGTKARTYICRKDTQEAVQQINGMEAYRILNQYYKVPDFKDSETVKVCGKSDDGGKSAGPILYYNEKFENQWLDAYCYDLNSAYAYAMLQPMPDTSVKPKRYCMVTEGKEIGFREIENPKKPGSTQFIAKFKGYAEYIFPLMDSPFTRFVERWYTLKATAPKGSKERNKAKCVLNYSVGQLQNHNPFLRATIITYCNNLIKQHIDEDTLFCNTDSIVSRKQLDLKLGSGCGEWKLEHQGKVAYRGYAYQWDNGEVSYRGIPKSWFPDNWDITKDPIPTFGNVCYFDDNLFQLVSV